MISFYDLSSKKGILKWLFITVLACMQVTKLSANASARPVVSSATSKQDSVQLLQQCLDQPFVQKYYTRHSDGTVKQVYIMQYPIRFPDSFTVTKFGQPVLFRTRADIRSEKAEVFLIFKTFAISGDDASIIFTLNSDYTTKPNIVEVTLHLHRSGSIWAVNQKQIRKLI